MGDLSVTKTPVRGGEDRAEIALVYGGCSLGIHGTRVAYSQLVR